MTRDANEYYKTHLESFDRAVSEAVRVSRAAAGRNVDDPKAWWASVLFTRLCTSSVSLLHLTPGSRYCGTLLNHYDSSATAALARNIIECYFMFFYLCVDPVRKEEWTTRLNLLYLHDCISRIRMFRDFNPEDPQLPAFEIQAEELRFRLTQSASFMAMPDRQRRMFLRGESTMLLSRDDLLERLGIEPLAFKGIYKFLSSHVHSAPLAFSRMGEGQRGRGVASEVELGYIAISLELAEDPLRRGTSDMLTIFPDIAPPP